MCWATWISAFCLRYAMRTPCMQWRTTFEQKHILKWPQKQKDLFIVIYVNFQFASVWLTVLFNKSRRIHIDQAHEYLITQNDHLRDSMYYYYYWRSPTDTEERILRDQIQKTINRNIHVMPKGKLHLYQCEWNVTTIIYIFKHLFAAIVMLKLCKRTHTFIHCEQFL